MFLKSFIVLLVVSAVLGASKNSVLTFRYFKCVISEKFIFKNFSCFTIVKGRDSTSLTGIVYFKQPLYEFNFEAIMMYKSGPAFREIAHVPPTEWCNLVKVGSTNILYYQVFKLLETGQQGLIHSCPYTDVIARNFTFHPEHIISMLPSGDYKLIIKITSSEGESMANVTITASFKL